MTSTVINSTMEPRSEITAEVTSDDGSEKDGQYSDENETCSSCKFRIEKRDREIRHLKLENKKLKQELAECRESFSGKCTHCHKACPLQAPTSVDSRDDLGEDLCGQNKGAEAVKGSQEMSRRNDSTQIKNLLNPESTGCVEGSLVDLSDKTQSEPSTSSTSSNRKGPKMAAEGATGGCDDSEFGKNCGLGLLKRAPYCHMQLEQLSFSRSHTVLVNVYAFNKGKSITIQQGQHAWDKLSVRMPYAEESMLAGTLMLQDKSRWKTIKKNLTQLAQDSSLTTKDIENAIKKYNPKYKNQWCFDALHRFFEIIHPRERETHIHTLKRMTELAMKLPDCCPKSIPLLRHGQSHSITLSQMQIACLLANAFFCTFPNRNATHPHADYANYPTINFHSLFGEWSERKNEKFKAIFHYFKVVTEKEPKGLVTFSRRYLQDFEFPQWKSCHETLTKLEISSEGTIERDGLGMLQVDFACNLVGGGVLGSGLVQEEILFLINPELIVARLFTEKLGDTECLKITGSQQYSEYSGFSDSFCWKGEHKDFTQRDEWMRLHRQIVAIDALHFRHSREQFSMKKVTRELNKAYCGFMGESNTHPDYYTAIATGNWGCGAFGGDLHLKALIQMMAAAMAKRDMAYFTFRNSSLHRDLWEFHHFLTKHHVSVGRLYRMLENFCNALYRNSVKTSDLYSFITQTVRETTSKQ